MIKIMSEACTAEAWSSALFRKVPPILLHMPQLEADFPKSTGRVQKTGRNWDMFSRICGRLFAVF